MAYAAPPNGGPYVAAPGYPPHDPVNPQATAYPYPQQQYGAPPPHAQQYAPPPQHAQYAPPPQYGAPAPSHPQPGGYQGPDAVAVTMPAAHHEHEHKKSGGGGGGVPTAGAGGYSAFMEKRVRMGFIRKVYAILTCQLLVTFGITFAFVFHEGLRTFVQTHPGAYYAALGINFALILVLACCRKTTQVVPWNYVLLGAFTLAESYLVGTISSFYDTNAVLLAFGICIGITIALTVFAFQTKIDFTLYAGVLVVALWSLVIFGFLMIWFRSQALMTFYAWIGAFLFGCFIVVDTQMIIGGKHALQFTPDDYISAALNLYLDVINLFLYILRIVGGRK